MSISVPLESVYYYERSKGMTRLFCFIPRSVLESYVESGLSVRAIHDYPDGIDIGCNKADIEEFEENYDFRLPILDPEAVERAFFAILSSTPGWEKFRGTGFLSESELVDQVARVERKLRMEGLLPEEKEGVEAAADSLGERRERAKERDDLRKGMYDFLEKLECNQSLDTMRDSFPQASPID